MVDKNVWWVSKGDVFSNAQVSMYERTICFRISYVNIDSSVLESDRRNLLRGNCFIINCFFKACQCAAKESQVKLQMSALL